MKPVLFLVGVFVLCSMPLSAQAVETETTQTINNEQGYAIINLEKVPATENKQSIKNTRSWFCINIIINGKVKDTNNTDSNAK